MKTFYRNGFDNYSEVKHAIKSMLYIIDDDDDCGEEKYPVKIQVCGQNFLAFPDEQTEKLFLIDWIPDNYHSLSSNFLASQIPLEGLNILKRLPANDFNLIISSLAYDKAELLNNSVNYLRVNGLPLTGVRIEFDDGVVVYKL